MYGWHLLVWINIKYNCTHYALLLCRRVDIWGHLQLHCQLPGGELRQKWTGLILGKRPSMHTIVCSLKWIIFLTGHQSAEGNWVHLCSLREPRWLCGMSIAWVLHISNNLHYLMILISLDSYTWLLLENVVIIILLILLSCGFCVVDVVIVSPYSTHGPVVGCGGRTAGRDCCVMVLTWTGTTTACGVGWVTRQSWQWLLFLSNLQ